MKRLSKSLIALASALALTACSVNEEGDGDNPNTLTFVNGDFFDASLTGDAYPDDSDGIGLYGDECVGQDHYFETDNGRVRVYGTPGFSETAFRLMATYIDGSIDPVLALFDTNWNTFVARRQLLNLGSMEELLRYQINEDGSVKRVLQNPYDTHAITDASQSYASWMAMTERQKQQTLDDVVVMLNQSYENGALIDPSRVPALLERDYIIACLSPEMYGNRSGEGTFHGMNLTADPDSYNGDFGKLFVHEMVHFVQENMTRVAGAGRSLPRWFSEGQAVMYANMSYYGPEAHYNYEPLDVVSISGETGDPGEAYKHYALAFNYLKVTNGKPRLANMLWDIRDVAQNPTNSGLATNEYSPRFIEAFNANIIDPNGNTMTLDDYRANYHNIMKDLY